MNQQNQGPSVPSSVPMKRKRGRPRKEENVVHGVQKPENVLNFNQTAGTTNNSDSGMLGKTVTGVIEASFNDGYLVNVKAADSDSFLRGVVFLHGQVMPVTAESDVAPHVQMINRKEFPIPMPNSQTNEVHVIADTEENVVAPRVNQVINRMFTISVPNSQTNEVQVMPVTAENDVAHHVQMINRKEFPIPMPNSQTNEVQVMPDTEENDVAPHVNQVIKRMFTIPMSNSQNNEVHGSLPPFQSIKPQIPVPLPGEHVLPTNVHSSISVPPGISEAEHVNQSSSCLNSEMDCDKTVEQSDKLHGLDASTQVEESGAAKESRPASETMNLFPTIENTDKKLINEQQVFPSMNQLNEVVHGDPNNSNIELNLVTVSAEPESMPSEQTSKPVENFVEKQNLPETDVQEDAKTKLVSIDTLSNIGNTSNSNGKPITGIANILELVPNQAVDTSQPESMQSEQVGQSDPSGNKLSYAGCDFMERSDPQNCISLGDDVNKLDFNHPTESLVDAVPSENQIRAGT